MLISGTENVEPADFKTCWKLVSETKKAKNRMKQIEEEKAREVAWQKSHGKSKYEESDPASGGYTRPKFIYKSFYNRSINVMLLTTSKSIYVYVFFLILVTEIL